MNQIEFYMAKLKYEIDSWDLSEAMKNNDGVVVVDTRALMRMRWSISLQQ